MKQKRVVILTLISLFVAQFLLSPVSSFAQLSGSQFKSGRIIDDIVFTNKNSMTPAQIQQFLESKVVGGSCDTDGSRSSTRWNTAANRYYTHAEWGGQNGNPAPFVCLTTYRENQTTKQTNLGNPTLVIEGSQTAAEIIYNAGQQYGINPQVLIVLLQKEQGLVTDDWPWLSQYTAATGAYCPDTAPCDATRAGFGTQVREAARLFRYYMENPWLYLVGTNNILFNPNRACGTSPVVIENVATAALYHYTPYQPNAAALNNLYGTGDGCSAYGNRNFWRMFNDWFGTTMFVNLPGCNEATNTSIACVWRLKHITTGEQVLVSDITERNTLVAQQGYAYEGVAFYGNVTHAPQPGNIPVYKLKKSNGATFITTNLAEKNAAVTSLGYTDLGIDFHVNPAGSNSGYPVYRLHNLTNGKHVWTAQPSEKQSLIDSGYVDEGVAFSSINTLRQETPPPTNQQLVFRFSNMPGNSHFWTTDLYERDNMILAGYRYEGVAWHASALSTGVEVYRLYSPRMQKHLYTTDASERDNLKSSDSWIYEGVGQYMSPTPTSRPVYRLYSPVTTNHLWTTDANEKDVLAASGTFRYEGIAWYQP